MAEAADVAACVLEKAGPMTAMKLQKLVYYCQAWSLVWDERPMFDDRIEAWANGPVIPSLYRQHRGRFRVGPGEIAGRPEALDPTARETVDAVLDYYGDKSAQWLSDLTHAETPWQAARAGRSAREASSDDITLASIAEYYGSLPAEA